MTDGGASFLSRLLESGSDVLLIGPSRADRPSLRSNDALERPIAVNCAIFRSVGAAQRELIEQLARRWLPPRAPTPKRFGVLLAALEALCSPLNSVCVVFRDCEQLFLASPNEFNAFFARYNAFVDAIDQNGTRMQTIVCSAIDIPLPFPRFLLCFPRGEALREHISKAIGARVASKENASEIAPFLGRTIARVAAFEIILSSRAEIEAVAAKLLCALIADVAAGVSDPFAADAQGTFARSESLLYRKPRLALIRKKAFFGLLETAAPSTSPQYLSPLCSCLLLAIHLCGLYSPTADLAIMGSARRTGDAPARLQSSNRPRGADVWRVLAMAQLVARQSGARAQLERVRAFHSNDFLGCFAFLVDVGLIESTARGHFEQSFRLRCDALFVEQIARGIGFGDEIALWADL